MIDSDVFAIPHPGAWAARGACRTVPTAAFFPVHSTDIDQAKRVCRQCPVLADCRDYIDAHPQLAGVWAASSEADRRARRPPPAAPDKPKPAPAEPATLFELLERLRAYPGRWVRVRSYASAKSAPSTASQLYAGLRPCPRGRWEFAGRANDAGGSDLFARYLGVAEEAS